MKVYTDFDLTDFNSYRLKAFCKRVYFPETDDDIKILFSNKGEKKILLGSGHNIILSKERYDNDFVVFSGNYDRIEQVEGDRILCEAGANMKQLTAFALKHGLSGLEVFFDIPSSVGGAVVMNAGAGGEDMNGLIVSVWYFNPDTNKIEKIDKEQIGFEYRNSFFQKNPKMIVCRALLQLKSEEKLHIERKMKEIERVRHAKQPRDYPNAGSVFKRPVGHFVGPMIDKLGLKGYSIGGAKISEKHSGFIVNFDNASGDDIIALINFVKKAVVKEFEVDLEVEQRII